MPAKPMAADELTKTLTGGSYYDKIERCRIVVNSFMKGLWETNGGYRGVKWDADADDPTLVDSISELAVTTANWRGVIMRGSDTGHDPPQIENPVRLGATLYAIARGYALIRGERQLLPLCIDVVWSIANSSMPEDRRMIFEALQSNRELSTTDLKKIVGASEPTAIKVRRELDALGVVELAEKTKPFTIKLV